MQYPCRLFLDSVLLLVVFVASLAVFSSGVQGDCSSDRFQCANSKCIPSNWQCDGEDDCGDASDESVCEERTCSGSEFECASGDQCIPIRWRCDGDTDCTDGSDEAPEGCANRSCPPTYFSCGEEESPCIPNTWVCDQEHDCGNGQDEANCNLLTCPPNEFKCHDDSQCISMRWVCDRDPDCTDGSDEADCSHTTCAPDYFMCNSTSHCIPDSWSCDGDRDCEDGSDETECETPPAVPECGGVGLYRCGNGGCIHASWKCDGEDDCGDNTDEDSVTCPATTCPPSRYTCRNGDCVIAGTPCNGINDCEDGSDEDEETCPTTARAVVPGETPQPATVLPPAENRCGPGFLDGGAGCQDINECLDTDRPVCSQECENTPGSFRCRCAEGYQLVNGSYCKAVGGHAWVVFIYHNVLRKFNLVTNESLAIYSDLPRPLAVEVDIHSNLVFWSDSKTGKIMKGSIDGQMTPVPVVEGVGVAEGIAYDWIHQNLYWTDTGHNNISVANINTGESTTLYWNKEGNGARNTRDTTTGNTNTTIIEEPRAIVVDPRNGYIYWTDWSTAHPRIERGAMDGSSRETIVHQDRTRVQWPNGLAIDMTRDRLYWVDSKYHILMSVGLDGADFRVVLHDAVVLQHPYQLAVFEDRVYWTDWDTDSVRSVNKFTGGAVADVVQRLTITTPNGLQIWQESKQPAGKDYCDAHPCSNIAVATPVRKFSAVRCACLCPTGSYLLEDGVTCFGFEPVGPATETNELPPYVPTGPGDHSDDDIPGGNDTIKSAPSSTNSLIWIIILAVVVIVTIILVLVFIVVKKRASGGKRSMNFDNPVYRKTTEDQLFLSTGSTYEHNKGNSTSSFTPMIQTEPDVII